MLFVGTGLECAVAVAMFVILILRLLLLIVILLALVMCPLSAVMLAGISNMFNKGAL